MNFSHSLNLWEEDEVLLNVLVTMASFPPNIPMKQPLISPVPQFLRCLNQSLTSVALVTRATYTSSVNKGYCSECHSRGKLFMSAPRAKNGAPECEL